jgi:hypothetical protein
LKKILGLVMVLMLALGVTGCGGSGGGGKDPIFPIEVSSNSKIILEKAHNYGFDYSSQIEVKNISNDQCTYSWDIELWSKGILKERVNNNVILKSTLVSTESEILSPGFGVSYRVDKAVLLITVGTETQRFNIQIVNNPTAE